MMKSTCRNRETLPNIENTNILRKTYRCDDEVTHPKTEQTLRNIENTNILIKIYLGTWYNDKVKHPKTENKQTLINIGNTNILIKTNLKRKF